MSDISQIAAGLDTATDTVDAIDDVTDAIDGDPEPDLASDQTTIDPMELLMRTPDGSIFDEDITELWNPEEGGVNRLLLCAETLAGTDGMPVIGHLLVAIAEIVVDLRENVENDEEGDDWV